jgi:hypothetical protein
MNSHSNDTPNHADNFSCPVSNKVCHNSSYDHTQTYMTLPQHCDYQICKTCDYLQINTLSDKTKVTCTSTRELQFSLFSKYAYTGYFSQLVNEKSILHICLLKSSGNHTRCHPIFRKQNLNTNWKIIIKNRHIQFKYYLKLWHSQIKFKP